MMGGYRHSATPAVEQQKTISTTAASSSSFSSFPPSESSNLQRQNAIMSSLDIRDVSCTASDDASKQSLSSAALTAPNPLQTGSSVFINASSSASLPAFALPRAALVAPSSTPNADQAFNWTIPEIKLSPPIGPGRSPTPAKEWTKQQAIRTRKRKRTATLSHFRLTDSRIDPPEFFALHLRRSQILEVVQKASGLPKALGGLVDQYKQARSHPDLPAIMPSSTILSPQFRRKYRVKDSDRVIEDEHGIAQMYEVPEQMAARVASTLYTDSPIWVDALEWKRQATHGMVHAVAGGYLYISPWQYYSASQSAESPDSKIFDKLDFIRDHLPQPGSPIIPWVFVPAGAPFGVDGDKYFQDDGEIFEVIQEMAEGSLGFSWTACESDTPLHASCNSAQHYNVFGQLSMTGHYMTDDASCTNDILASADPVILVHSSTTGKSYRLPLVRRACFVVQKAWTVAVANDATYVVISTGGKEMIAIRNRHDRSFHFSGVLEVSRDCAQSANSDTPSHVKLHTGLILAALEDIEERILNMIARRSHGEEPSHSKEFFDIGATDFPALIRMNYPRGNAAEIPRELRWPVEDVRVFLGRQSEPYTFQRSEAHIKKFHFIGPVDKRLVIMIHTEIDSTTFLCHLRNSEGLPVGNYFVAKFSRGWMATEKLRSEAFVYGHFQRHKVFTGIPSCFGHFESPMEPDGSAHFALLLLEVCDKPMAAQTRLSGSIKKELRQWLVELHDAGIVHGRLSPTNIMFDEDKHGLQIRVLSWGNAESIVDDNSQELPGAESKRQRDRNALEAAFTDVQRMLTKEKAKKTREDKKMRLAKKLKTA